MEIHLRTTLAIWDDTVLLATRHKRTHPHLDLDLMQPVKAGTRFIYQGGIEG